MAWRLDKLKFLLCHIEDFIDRDWQEIKERAQNFAPQTGLETIEDLVEPLAATKDPLLVLDRLHPFFDSGLLLQDWKVTDILWRGSVFHLDGQEQAPAVRLKNSSAPSKILSGSAKKILQPLGLEFLSQTPSAKGFLVKPTPDVAFVLFSDLADPWMEGHIRHAHRLINKAFIF